MLLLGFVGNSARMITIIFFGSKRDSVQRIVDIFANTVVNRIGMNVGDVNYLMTNGSAVIFLLTYARV